MELMNKAVVVAEINKLKGKVSDESSYCNGWQHALRMLEIELNTLEVKEKVDIEKELNDYGYHYDYVSLIGRKELVDFAKHFFELGFKVQKGE